MQMAIQDDIDSLTAAIAVGEQKVRFRDGREVTYHRPQDLIAARDYLVNLQAAEQPRSRSRYLTHGGRGFQ